MQQALNILEVRKSKAWEIFILISELFQSVNTSS